MQRLQSHRQFNNSVEKRVRKDELIGRIAKLFKSNGINAQSIRAIDPSLRPFEVFEDIGVEFLFRCVEALGYEVKVEIVPKGKAMMS